MKLTKFANLAVLGLVVVVAVSGCRKRPTPLTVLPNQGMAKVGEGDQAPPFGTENNNKVTGTENPTGDPQPGADKFANYTRNAEIFKANTVYFDFDSSNVKAGEKNKINEVADYLKAHPVEALSIEGHCDERGTEEYNRALGERRALALREEIIRQGVSSEMVVTTSFGKDRPADPDHNEAAWRKNRRGEFILLTPPTAP
jgi:peptidoglycan-associated lipoprotein